MAKQKLFYFQAYDQRQQWQKGSLVAQSKQAVQFLLIAKGFSHIHLRFQIETFVGWNEFLDGTVCIEFEFIDCHLTMESTVGMRIVVAMIYDVVVVTFLEHAVVSRTMNGSVGIGLEDSSVVGIRTERTLGCGIIHTVTGILASSI